MDELKGDPGSNRPASMASSAMIRAPSNDSQFDTQQMLFDSEIGTPARRPRGFLDRMLGRTQSGGHRATASMSILIPPASSMSSNDPKMTGNMRGDSTQTSPVSRTRSNLAFQTPSGSTSPSTVTPTTTSPGHPPLSTLNTLSNSERAELVKRNRKLVQILGNELSGADAFLSSDDPHALPLNVRNAFIGGATYKSSLSASESLGSLYRRHSLPISPTSREPILSPRVIHRNFLIRNGNEFSSSSGESGDDPEWEDAAGDDVSRRIPNSVLQVPRSAPLPAMPSKTTKLSIPLMSDSPPSGEGLISNQRTIAHTPSIDSITTTVSNDEDDARSQSPEDAERARKRATLAKLHRFLGSCVPPEAILPTLPPEAPAECSETMKRAGTIQGRSTAIAGSPLARESELESSHRDPISPGKVKATRKLTASASLLHPPSTHIPIAYMSDGELDGKWSTLTGAQRLHLIRKQKKLAKMLGQCPPGMMKHQSDFLIKGDSDENEPQPGFMERSYSKQYVQHRYSIDSLAYLVKTNDQDQLQDLLTYIKDYDDAGSLSQRPRQGSSASSRPRGSLSGSVGGSIPPPSPTDSVSHLATPSVRGGAVEAHGFQQRRKRAAKLSSFFGVEYRELFTEVLDVIESEVQSDSIIGTLSPEETQELLAKLRKLKRA